jgi:phosphatidylserine decarboxylase
MTRRLSRWTGYACNMPLPPYLRKYMYLGFGKLYGVNFDDILEEDINNFRTFNQFFTREIKPDARTLDKVMDPTTMCSPCDGRILSFGEVNNLACTIDCIKGNDYQLDEFLFGYKT